MTVFISKGDTPMTYRQAVKRGLRYFESQKAQWEREQAIFQGDPEYDAWAAQWVSDNIVNAQNNEFNRQLDGYNTAVARLAKFKLADGQPEIKEMQPTGEWVLNEETGELEEEIIEVIVQQLVEPLDPTVERETYDEMGNSTGTETIINPEITRDEEERAAAQAVIDATPQEVKDFAANE
jgi:hypothetical protein